MNTQNHLFIYTIGPVQSFIAQARKTQDLWGGSTLLSEILQETALYAHKKYQAEIIFPAVQNSKLSMPNRFLAFIQTENMKIVGNELAQFAQTTLKTLAENAIRPYSIPKYFYEQIEHFLQIHWAALPCEREQYSEKFAEIERLLAAAKNVRTFTQLQEEPGRKCSLSGERIALFYNKERKPSLIAPSAEPIHGHLLNQGEGLDAIGFLKRTYKSDHSFPSTAEVALKDTLTFLKDDLAFQVYGAFFIGLAQNQVDAQLYYEENLCDEYFKKNGLQGNMEKARDHLKNKIMARAKEKGYDFKKYYAVVMLDGDSVGAWLSGKRLSVESKYQQNELYKYHQHVTNQLAQYAEFVDSLFQNSPQKGAKVYCGGDDVLAFVNLAHLTSVLKELRNNVPDLDGTGRFTASAGVVIAHYKMPLSEVLKSVRHLEKEAKQKDDDKDKLAISVMKHSGDIEKCIIPWKLKDGIDSLLVLQELLDAWREELLSPAFVRYLIRTFTLLMDEKGDFLHPGIVEAELERLIKRSVSPKKGNTKEGIKRINTLVDQLKLFLHSGIQLADFQSFLSIADFMERKVRS